MQILGIETPISGEQLSVDPSRFGDGTVDKFLYMLATVNMPLFEVQFCSQYLRFAGIRRCRGSDLVPQGNCQATLFTSSDSCPLRCTI